MILVCVAAFSGHPRFAPEFTQWYAHATHHHPVTLCWPMRRTALHLLQGQAVKEARRVGATHILWVEDDHWGLPKEGLTHLLELDLDHVGLWTFSKTYPYKSLAMRKKEPGVPLDLDDSEASTYWCVEPAPGEAQVQPVDLVSFGFALTKVSVFDTIDDPFLSWRQKPTDSILCEHMLAKGLQPHVCFKWALAHGDISPAKRWADLALRGLVEERIEMPLAHIRTIAQQSLEELNPGAGLQEFPLAFTQPLEKVA